MPIDETGRSYTDINGSRVYDSFGPDQLNDPLFMANSLAQPNKVLDPRFIQYAQKVLGGRPLTEENLRAAGIKFPDGYRIVDGQVQKDHDWINTALMAGTAGVFAAPALAGALGGAAGGSSLAPVSANVAAPVFGAAPTAGGLGISATAPTFAGGAATTGGLGVSGVAAPTFGAGTLGTAGTTVAGGGGFLSRAGDWLGGRLKGQAGDVLSGFSEMTDAATANAVNGRLEGDKIGIAANNSNISGRDAYENQLNNRADLEMKQRKQALADVYRAGWYQNRQPGPFNPGPMNPIGPNYMNTMGGLEQEAMKRLGKPAEYGTNNFSPLNPYEDYVPQGPGTLERMGNIAGPILRGAGVLLGSKPKTEEPK